MQKTEIVKLVAKDLKISEKDVTDTINSFIEITNDLVYRGVDVTIQNFVSFKTVTRKAYVARNPQNDEKVNVPRQYVLKTSSPKAFKKRISQKPVY